LTGPMCLGRTSEKQGRFPPRDGQEAERAVTGNVQGSGHVFKDLFPSGRLHLPKFPEPPKITSAAGDQGFNT
jgi:hypothetical protein